MSSPDSTSPSSPLHNPVVTAVQLVEMGRMRDALDLLRRAALEYPESYDIPLLLAQILGQLGYHEEAEQEARRAVALAPELAETHCALAFPLHHLKRGRDAVAAAREAVRLAPSSPDILVSCASILSAIGYEEEALAWVEHAIALAPGWAAGYSVRAGLHGDNLRRVQEDLRRAIELDPTNPSYHNNLGAFLHRHGHPDKAVRYFAEAARLNPSSPAIVDNVVTSTRQSIWGGITFITFILFSGYAIVSCYAVVSLGSLIFSADTSTSMGIGIALASIATGLHVSRIVQRKRDALPPSALRSLDLHKWWEM